jgi:hypothetical protein
MMTATGDTMRRHDDVDARQWSALRRRQAARQRQQESGQQAARRRRRAARQLQKLLLLHPRQVDLQVFYFDLLEIFMEVPVLAFDT